MAGRGVPLATLSRRLPGGVTPPEASPARGVPSLVPSLLAVGLRRAGCKATASEYPLSNTQTAAQCVVTPGVLQEVYGITESVVTDSKCTHGVFETQQQYYNPTDLGTYASAMPHVKTDQAAHIHAHGSNNPSKAGGEATLDVQVLTGVAQNAPTTFYSLAMNSQEVTRLLVH